MLGCMCIYCTNVKLKLLQLNIDGIKSEHDLYNRLICDKLKGQKFRKWAKFGSPAKYNLGKK